MQMKKKEKLFFLPSFKWFLVELSGSIAIAAICVDKFRYASVYVSWVSIESKHIFNAHTHTTSFAYKLNFMLVG